MKMSRDFVKAVFSEVKNIRNLATDEEKNRINPEKFNGFVASGCIYGLMSGGYATDYCDDLMDKFATGSAIYQNDKFLFEPIKGFGMTPLERFIWEVQGSLYALQYFIPYIKGEIKRLPSMASFIKNNQ